MKHIKLSNLTIENFKGIKETSVDFSDKVKISAKNAGGKTTLMDAFTWLLFDKDSTGSSNFAIRPKDESGKDIDDIVIMVEAVLVVDGEEIILTKSQKQKWAHKRGSSAPTYEGNENSFQINNFPVKKSDFDKRIRDIVNEDLFKLLTSPRAFASLPWKDQRKMLMQFVGETTDEDILNLDEILFEPIRNDVLAAGADKSREKAMSTLRDLKKQQELFPVRIDECQRSFRVVGGTEEYLLGQKQKLENEIKKIRSDRDGLTDNTSLMADINKEMMAVKGRMSEIERNANDGLRKKTADAYKEYMDACQEYKLLRGKIDRTERAITEIKRSIQNGEAEVSGLAEKWKTIKARVLPERETVCPTCGRPFEADKAEEIKAEFEKRKSADLAAIEGRGKSVRAEVSDMKAKLEEFETALKADKVKALELLDKTDGLEAAYVALKDQPYVDVSQEPEYKDLSSKLEALHVTFIQLSEGNKADKKPYEEAEQKALSALNAVDAELATIQANRHLEVRIAELKSQQMECAQKIADQEQKVFLLEEFVRTKMNTLSERINSHFKKVRFRLFNQAINGSITETCTMQINSNGSYVDYSDANNGAKIIGGLDVIDALSDLYQVSAPIFVDNSEALDRNNQPDSQSQMILLAVSDDEELTVTNL